MYEQRSVITCTLSLIESRANSGSENRVDNIYLAGEKEKERQREREREREIKRKIQITIDHRTIIG